MSTAVITSTEARFSATWTVEVLIEPGSIPDRPMPYSRAGSLYRVQRVTLEFITSASDSNPAALKLTSLTVSTGPLLTARDSVRLYRTDIYGPRLKKDGTPGQHVVTERFYGQERAPEWLRELIDQTREQLT